jgi:hypothetical protein
MVDDKKMHNLMAERSWDRRLCALLKEGRKKASFRCFEVSLNRENS